MKECKYEVFEDGNKYWYLDGKFHREDGPAIEREDGTKEWWLNGKRHREGGLAVECADGDKEWWLNGKEVTKEEHKRATAKDAVKREWVGLTDEERYLNDGRSEEEIEYARAIEAKLKEKNMGVQESE